jgi:hypothetical protein
MCMTIRNGALAVNTPLVMEPCGAEDAVGQLFDELTAVNGTAPDGNLVRAFAESGRKTDNPGELSPYCLASRGGAGSAVVLARCNNRLATQGWFLGAEGAPSDPTPAGDPDDGP